MKILSLMSTNAVNRSSDMSRPTISLPKLKGLSSDTFTPSFKRKEVPFEERDPQMSLLGHQRISEAVRTQDPILRKITDETFEKMQSATNIEDVLRELNSIRCDSELMSALEGLQNDLIFDSLVSGLLLFGDTKKNQEESGKYLKRAEVLYCAFTPDGIKKLNSDQVHSLISWLGKERTTEFDYNDWKTLESLKSALKEDVKTPEGNINRELIIAKAK